MVRVFLSGASEDRPALLRVAEALRREGHEPVLDLDEVVPGQSLVEAVRRIMARSDALIIGLSREAERSRFLWSEIETFRRQAPGKPAYVVRFDLAPLPPELSDLEVFDLRSDSRERQIERLLARLVQPVSDGLPPNNLPVRPATFVDRTAELAWLQQHLRQGEPVILVGEGGMGKTALAIEVAHRVAHEMPGGIWWVDGGREPRDAYLALSSVLRERAPVELRDRIERRALTGSPNELARAVVEGLVAQAQPSLLIVDGLTAEASRWVEWMPSGAVHPLVTMRDRPAGLPGNVRELGPLPHDDAMALFSRLLESAAPDDAQAWLPFITGSHGSPQRVRIAAMLARRQPGGSPVVDDVLTKLTATLELSDRPASKVLTGTLPFAAVPVPIEWAAMVADVGEENDLPGALDVLQRHEILRRDGDSILVDKAVRALLLDMSGRAIPVLRARAEQVVAAWILGVKVGSLVAGQPRLEHAEALARDDAPSATAWRAVLQERLAQVRRRQGDRVGALELLERAERNARAHRSERADIYIGVTTMLARVAEELGLRDRAEKAIAESLAAAGEATAGRTRAVAFRRAGDLYLEWGDTERARSLHQKAVDAARDATDEIGAGVARWRLGLALAASGDLAGAVDSIRRAVGEVALARTPSAHIRADLGRLLVFAGDLTAAREVFEALWSERAREPGEDDEATAATALTLAALAIALGERRPAMELGERYRAVWEDSETMAASAHALAAVLDAMTDPAPARTDVARAAVERASVGDVIGHLLRRALAAFLRTSADASAVGGVLVPTTGAGELALLQALNLASARGVNPGAYRDALGRALQESESSGDYANAARAAFLLADFLGRGGAWEQAAPVAEHGLRCARRAADPRLVAHAYRLLADVALHGSRYEDARLGYEEAIRRFDELSADEEAATSRLLYVNLLLQLGRREAATRHVERLRSYLGRAPAAWPYPAEAEQTLRLFDESATEDAG